MRRRGLVGGVLTLAACGLVAGPAQADVGALPSASIGTGQPGDTREGQSPTYAAQRILFFAGTTRRDEVKLDLNRSGKRFVLKANRPVRAGGGCTRTARKKVSCSRKNVAGIGFFVADKPDSVVVSRRVRTLIGMDGGGGNDRLNGGSGSDLFAGKAGNDKARGGLGNDAFGGSGGRDRLYGGPGDDTLTGGPGRDRLKGGPGKNTVRQ